MVRPIDDSTDPNMVIENVEAWRNTAQRIVNGVGITPSMFDYLMKLMAHQRQHFIEVLIHDNMIPVIDTIADGEVVVSFHFKK
jgi:hypothetical protein